MSDQRQPAKMGIYEEDGKVLCQLPDFYLELTPEQARKWATHLFIKAAQAEGKEAPQLVMLPSN